MKIYNHPFDEKQNDFKLVSLDVFQTLMDVNTRRDYVWRSILGDSYSETLAEEYWNDANNLVFSYFNKCVSDADRDMVSPLLERFIFDKVFLSEDYHCYKFDPKGHIFNEVIGYYKVNPEEIIHIGDGYSDIVGANRVGIKTCWLNRRNVK